MNWSGRKCSRICIIFLLVPALAAGAPARDVQAARSSSAAAQVSRAAQTFVVSPAQAGTYHSIQSAVNAAASGDTILILPGTYTEAVDCRSKTLNIVGTSKESCILTWSGLDYYHPPLEMSTGSLRNLTIHAAATGTPGIIPGAYCLHADFDQETGGSLVIDNVRFVDDVTTAVGIATRAHFTAQISNCEIITYSDAPALFTHDWETGGTAADTAGQILSVQNCQIRNCSGTRAALTIHSQEVSAGAATIRLVGNTVTNDAGGPTVALYRYGGRCLYPLGYLGGSDFLLSRDSEGNSDPQMNSSTYCQPAGPAAATAEIPASLAAAAASAAAESR